MTRELMPKVYQLMVLTRCALDFSPFVHLLPSLLRDLLLGGTGARRSRGTGGAHCVGLTWQELGSRGTVRDWLL